MSESSHTTTSIDCYCGRRAVIRTSWMNENPGRRFLSCLNYKDGGCGYFHWQESPLCDRARTIIPGLLRKINRLDDENKKLIENKQNLEEINKKLIERNKILAERNRNLVQEKKKMRLMLVIIPLGFSLLWMILSKMNFGSKSAGLEMIG
ncbi:hypothetical protein DH2020_025763 [Rehmannia glutinosa]|uniref:GRF-type domain-containing protein n=1 Tax=Rehmannia glutinosa TaxID=99300 RepID=A0ABR0VZR2_REHGL